MILCRCYLSQNRDPVIGVKIPLSEGATGRSSLPTQSNRYPWKSSFPRLQAGEKLDRHIEHITFPGSYYMAKLSSCVYWLSGPEVFCTSTVPVGFPGTPLNGSRG